jgi:hypothetical protein
MPAVASLAWRCAKEACLILNTTLGKIKVQESSAPKTPLKSANQPLRLRTMRRIIMQASKKNRMSTNRIIPNRRQP